VYLIVLEFALEGKVIALLQDAMAVHLIALPIAIIALGSIARDEPSVAITLIILPASSVVVAIL
jgi:hypothetical protein